MTLKKFSIFSAIIISVIILLNIILCFIVIPTPFKITADPSSITIYNYSVSSTGKTITKSNSYKEHYNNLLNAFIYSTNLSIFERAVSGSNVFDKATQDVGNRQPNWNSVKNKNVTIEMNFSEKQSIIVCVNGNTKQIDYYGIALVVNNNTFVKDTVIYYKTSSGGAYTNSPIILGAKTNKLYKIITSI